jgi:hypothetical protein
MERDMTSIPQYRSKLGVKLEVEWKAMHVHASGRNAHGPRSLAGGFKDALSFVDGFISRHTVAIH